MKKNFLPNVFMMMVFFVISVLPVIASDDMETEQDQSYLAGNAEDNKNLEEFEESQEPVWGYDEEGEQKNAGNQGSDDQEAYEEYKPDEYAEDSYNQEAGQQEIYEENNPDEGAYYDANDADMKSKPDESGDVEIKEQ